MFNFIPIKQCIAPQRAFREFLLPSLWVFFKSLKVLIQPFKEYSSPILFNRCFHDSLPGFPSLRRKDGGEFDEWYSGFQLHATSACVRCSADY